MKKLNFYSNTCKHIFKFQLIFSIIFLSPVVSVHAQTLVNQLFEIQLNYPDTLPWSSSVMDGGNLITSGNTWHNATQKTNIVTTKTNQGGSVVWQTEYNGTLSGFDYGAAVTVDGSGNVFVTGATHNTSSYTFDIVVIKYNSSGVQQWATLFNGAGSDNDIPSDIVLDGSGNIYVCGATTGSTTGYDYLTMKLNSSGTTQWTKTYDYTSLNDIPGYIAYNSSTSKIAVAGASQSSSTNWDYTTLKYNTSGTLTNTNRSAASGYGLDRPTGLVTDASDNYYITGYTFNGDDYDMRTIKLDDDLSAIWTKTEDGGQEDGSNAMCIDGSSNIYIAGFTESSAGNKLMKIVKYNSAGTKVWEKVLQNSSNDIDAEATAIAYNSTTNKVLVTGFYEYTSGKKVITTYALNVTNGNVVVKKDFPNITASIDVPTGIHTSGNNIWVYGRRTEDDTTRYVTIKYETYEHPTDNILDSLDTPICRNNELIVRFNPALLDKDFIDNKQQVFANLETILADTTYDKIASLLKGSNNQFTPKAIKIYKQFTTDDTVSITRTGAIYKIPEVWAGLIVTCNTDVEVFNLADTLNTMEYEILWAHPNFIGHFSENADDEDYPVQHSLFTTSPDYSPDSHIEIEGAWEFETGNENIKVAVIGNSINWEHEDFGYGIDGLTNVKGGYDFIAGTEFPAMEISTSQMHETNCAGIIAALRNNPDSDDPERIVGIAGIAGGDNTIGIDNKGVSLITLAVNEYDATDGAWSISAGSEAIITSAYDGGEAYSAIDILSMSLGSNNAPFELQYAVDFAYKNEVVFVAARGNGGIDDSYEEYPASLRIGADNWRILCVGAGGTNGERKISTNSGAIGSSAASIKGGGIDLIAPGAGEMIWTTDIGSTYTNFWNTSAATPHVAGVAALMLSYINENPASGIDDLSPEDVEYILQESADNTALVPAEYDDETGHGMLNATNAMEWLELPHNVVKHYPISGYTLKNVYHYLGEEVTIKVPFGTPGLLFGGAFIAEPWYVTFVYPNNLPESATLKGCWVRNALTTGCPSDGVGSEIDEIETYFRSSELISYSDESTSIGTRVYKVTKDIYGDPLDDAVWYPVDPNTEDIKVYYSLYYFDPEAELNIDDVVNSSPLLIKPNPTSGLFTVSIPEYNAQSMIEIFNTSGKLIQRLSFNESCNNFSIDITDEVNGMYIIKLLTNGSISTGKIIKQ